MTAVQLSAAPPLERPRVGVRPGLVAALTIAALLVAGNIAGMAYYALPMAERVRSPLHVWLRPAGYVGQSAGILAVLSFLFLWLYPIRKRYKSLAWTGSVGAWLDVHITAALLLPLLVAIHAAWRFGGVIGLGFDAMMIVWASGVVGRYLYVRIPRSRSGIELTLDEIASQRRTLVTELAAKTGLDPAQLEESLSAVASSETDTGGVVHALAAMVTADLTRWRMTRTLRTRWRRIGNRALDGATLAAAVALATREIRLEQQVRLLRATHRIFRYWHVVHRPVAIMALIAVAIHVAVVVYVGATWFY
jgi:hypothetical protein